MKNLYLYLSLLFILTCAKEDSQAPNTPPTQIVKQYTLTASAGDGGSVSGGGTFASGTQVSLTATPTSGYSFSGWSNGTTANPLTVTLNSNTSITANFQVIVNSYTLSVTAGEGGSVSTEGGEYQEGTEVTITATPEEGYGFIGWNGSDSTSSTISVTLAGNTTIEAIFRLFPQFTLPETPSKMFTKGVGDTLSIGFSHAGGYKTTSLSAEYGSVSVISEPAEGDTEGNIVIEYTVNTVENVDWTRTIAGTDNIEINFTGVDDLASISEYQVRTQPEPNFYDFNTPTHILRNIKYPFDIPKIRYQNLRDNYAEKNTCDGSETLMGENGISLNQFNDSYGTDLTELGVFADFNGDGYLDLVTYGGYIGFQGHGIFKSPIEIYLYKNGEYKYYNVLKDVLVYSPAKIYITDFNNDTKPDIVLSSFNHDNNIERTNTLILLNNSDQVELNFEIIDLGYSSRYNSKSIYDYDNDGYMDFYQYTDNGNIRYRNNNGTLVKDDNYFFNGGENAPNFNYSNDFSIADINNDGAMDILLTGAEFAHAMGIFWGCSEVTNCDSSTQPNFNPNRFSVIPSVNGWGLALEHNLYDIDNDGTLEIIINRTGATLEDPESNSPNMDDFHLGWNFQLLKVQNNTEITDLTTDYFLNFTSERIGGNCQGENHYIFNMGLFDYDNDGFIEFFNLPDQGIIHHEWEWNGSKFLKVD